MYLSYFSLKEHPFRLNADPRFLYMSGTHRKALSYLQYGLEMQDSLVLMSGEIGSGKTTLINQLTHQLGNAYQIARIHQTQLQENDFLQTVLVAFGQSTVPNAAKFELLATLNQFLLAEFRRGKHPILIIDEAQHLSAGLFEEIRLLADSEQNGKSLISVLLVGQPELREILDQPELVQLKQRIRLRTHLQRLGLEEMVHYISHRMAVAGVTKKTIFAPDSHRAIYHYTGGCLRLVNILCDYALTHCFTEGSNLVTADVIRVSSDELGWEPFDQVDSVNEEGTRLLPILNATPILKLLVTNIEGQVEEYSIRKNSKIGRHKDNDIVIDTPRISRYHAEILDRNGRWYIRDLESMNGTKLNQKNIDLMSINTGDIISVGGATIRCIIPYGVDNTGLITLNEDHTRRIPTPIS